jgi:hypothetical protein
VFVNQAATVFDGLATKRRQLVWRDRVLGPGKASSARSSAYRAGAPFSISFAVGGASMTIGISTGECISLESRLLPSLPLAVVVALERHDGRHNWQLIRNGRPRWPRLQFR